MQYADLLIVCLETSPSRLSGNSIKGDLMPKSRLVTIVLTLALIMILISNTEAQELEQSERVFLPIVVAGNSNLVTNEPASPTAPDTATSAGQQTAETLYGKLQRLANEGDEQASAYLVRLHDYLQRKSQPVPPVEEKIGSKNLVNGATVVLQGHKPFYLKLYNESPISSLAELETYISTRSQALTQLVEMNPDRALEVSVSFHDHLDLERVWGLKETYQIDIDGMTVQLFVGGAWHSVMFVGDPVEPDDRSYINFETPVAAFITQLASLMKTASDGEAMPDPSKVVFKADWIRATMPANHALALNSLSEVTLVDPISDFLDSASEQALDVIVVDVPNLRAKREVLQTLSQR